MSTATKEASDILQRLLPQHRDLLAAYDPDRAIALLNSVRPEQAYNDIPDALAELWREVTARFGEGGFAAFQALTMLRLMERFNSRASGRRYTDAIRECFAKSFRRILLAIEDAAYPAYRKTTDLLLKDLAICRQQMFPAGVRLVEPLSLVEGTLAVCGGPLQALRFLALMAETGGRSPFYRVHVHLSELDDFTPDGWIRCCVRLADMLEINPEIRGVVGGSWFYDPAVSRVSPHLAYLRVWPEQNGARTFFRRVEPDGGGAFATSQTRRNQFASGRYVPKAYALVWSRRALIACAKCVREAERSSPNPSSLVRPGTPERDAPASRQPAD